jgi:hypothetical protein
MHAALRRLFGGLTLVAFVSSLLAPVLTASHIAGRDDPDCSPEALSAGNPVAQFEPGSAPKTGHCGICHWLRAVATATPSDPVVVLHGLLLADAPPVLPSVVDSRLPVSGLTTRGPPTLHA